MLLLTCTTRSATSSPPGGYPTSSTFLTRPKSGTQPGEGPSSCTPSRANTSLPTHLASPFHPVSTPADALKYTRSPPPGPEWNQYTFFAVQPGHSFHSVEEVVHPSKSRLSISGWFHRPQQDEEGYDDADEKREEEERKDHASAESLVSSAKGHWTCRALKLMCSFLF